MKQNQYTANSQQTRERLLVSAKRIFARKGYEGASIANIADELGITKQALLYHFGSKGKLYGEIIKQINARLFEEIEQTKQESYEPALRLEHFVMRYFAYAMANPDEMSLLMREALGNRARAEHARNWPLKLFFDEMIALVKSNPEVADASDPVVFAFIYQVLSGILVFAVSPPSLTAMYGEKDFQITRDQFPLELQNHIRWFLKAAAENAKRE
ncbi:MAG: TetR/AcrR family transcriptional regulator [Rhizobiaceae bacterium]